MSLTLPSRRLLNSASSSSSSTPNSLLPALLSLSLASARSSITPYNGARTLHTTPVNSWFWNRSTKEKVAEAGDDNRTSSFTSRRKLLEKISGRMEAPAMFEEERAETHEKLTKFDKTTTRRRVDSRKQQQRERGMFMPWGTSLAYEHHARASDPDPRSRARWQRKMVMKQVKTATDPFSVEPKEARLKRTERSLLFRSREIGTSTKKLVKIANQLSGKTVADALVQLRYSKKKASVEVQFNLEHAVNQAIVSRGMGLGLGIDTLNDPLGRKELSELEAIAAKAAATANAEKSVKIQTKDGRHIEIDNPTRVYIDQAWVGRGEPWAKKIKYCARGRMNQLIKPRAHISFILKEEKTRIREFQEREAKKLRRGPWVHLPDRPVTAQRQYYSW
ncbi:ribosomal protein L22/L17 [Lasiosphaeris hirsuta]|uniref:Ribosomal protein L22/L17 n=1 Tax=Lasiosphaeris hirsuta TaxID=260670 RepID=A0AA40A3I6_9PEZI|nr:ribosomal protein L22/L17 [Lasiosphaeris hirsuta]